MDSKIEKLEKKINKNLKKYWNFDNLKDKQMEVILNFQQEHLILHHQQDTLILIHHRVS